jgi:hypothetical protein
VTMPEDITFREHFEELLANAEKLQDERWAAHRKVHDMGQIAMDAAVTALNARLEQMNQFRTQILEERRDFLRTELYSTEHKALEAKMENENARLTVRLVEMEKYRSNMEGRMWMLGAGITMLTLAVNIIFKYWGR